MQRIPNPVSDLNIFLRVFRDVHELLKDYPSFGLDDISQAMISKNNVTSQGAIGEEALKRSTREDRSRDPIYNQSKAYAELFRTLGWIQSTGSQLNYSFSLLGEHIAQSANPSLLLKECLLGIAYPNEVLGVQSNQTVRVIASILLAMNSLGNISRDEMIAGPMSIEDDSSKPIFKQMINQIAKSRLTSGMLDDLIDAIASRRGISRKPTMENYTRFPIAALVWSGWGEKRNSRGTIYITDAGKEMASKLNKAQDLRLNNFKDIPDEVKPSFIRWTFYSMLSRAGFNIDPVINSLKKDKHLLVDNNINIKDVIYFSPFQQLSRETIQKWVPEFISLLETNYKESKLSKNINSNDSKNTILRPKLLFESSIQELVYSDATAILRKEIAEALKENQNIDKVADSLISKYKESNKDIFYPLIVNLLCILGFNCKISRGGQNYERADAIILDKEKSIPIEIKSPGEESEISVKGVRQALENKIILLSRKNYPTDKSTTSLVIGFNPPNERSEVHELIENIWNAFGVRVGVIDFRSLLIMAISAEKSGKKINIKDFNKIIGVISV